MGAGVLDVLRDPLPWEVVLWPMGQGELVDLSHDTDPMRSPFISVALDAETTLSAEAVDQVYFRTERACLYSRSSGLTEKSLENAWVQEGCRAIGIGLDTPGMSDFGVVDGIVCDRAFVEDRRHRALELTTVQEAHAGGFADQEGVGRLITALAIARALDVTPEEIGGALRGLSS
jgi:UDP-N-acetylmuramoylalanine--D-glutamate ligase